MTLGQVSKLEEAWKVDAAATVDQLDQPGLDDQPAHVALRCVSGQTVTCRCFLRRLQGDGAAMKTRTPTKIPLARW